MSFFLLLAACDGGGFLGSGDDGGIVEIRVEPETISMEARDGAAAETDFTAVAVFGDGSEREIDLVAWESSNQSAGTIDEDGHFTSKDTNGGITTVTATHVGVAGSGEVTVVFVDSIVNGDLPGIDDAFRSAEASGGGPEILYPEDGLRLPRNLEGLSFFWDRDSDDQVSRLRLRSAITDISVYTAGESYTLNSTVWEQISASNREGEVEVSVSLGSWDGSQVSGVVEGPSQTLTVNRFDARGSVVYWASAEGGILRIPFGELEPEIFYRPEDDRCVGCHAISNERDRMVVTHGGINGMFEVVDISDPADPAIEVDTQPDERSTFKSIHPDGTHMMASTLGELSLYQLWDGAHVATYTSEDYLTQPDFSPDGTEVVAVRAKDQNNPDEFRFELGEIVKASFDLETAELGEWEVLVASDGSNNRYYPTFSPSGEWIAFNKAPGPAYAHRAARLSLVKADGSIIIDLNKANGDGELQNSWPRWGPLPDDDILWLAYSSRREYPGKGASQQPQIWITGIDERLAEQGVDPSSAPFWLPGQDVDSDNHIPVWWEK